MSHFKHSVLLKVILVLVVSVSAYGRYSGGSGTPDDPYQIATAADLILLGETQEDYDKHFVMTADIDLDPNLLGGEGVRQSGHWGQLGNLLHRPF